MLFALTTLASAVPANTIESTNKTAPNAQEEQTSSQITGLAARTDSGQTAFGAGAVVLLILVSVGYLSFVKKIR